MHGKSDVISTVNPIISFLFVSSAFVGKLVLGSKQKGF